MWSSWSSYVEEVQGRIQGGGGRTRRAPPLKLEKIWFFFRKIVIFHTIYPKNVRAFPPQLEKIRFFWRKIVIFHTIYPKNFRAFPPQLEKIQFFGVKSWFFTRNTQNFSHLPPLGAFFLSAPPLTWNPGSAPEVFKS
jgi:hypothetical protein